METFEQENAQPYGLHITPDMEADMAKTGKWSMFFAVLTFIFVGLYGLIGLIGMAALSAYGSSIFGENSAISGVIMLAILLVIAILGLVLMQAIYQLRFANNVTRAINFSDGAAMTQAWKNMRNYWRMLGILLIATVVLYVIIFAAIGVAGLSNLDNLLIPD